MGPTEQVPARRLESQHRAKDKSFNATLKTDFDESIGKILILLQDIVRVLINLFNNAFYAVQKSKKQNTQNAGIRTDCFSKHKKDK